LFQEQLGIEIQKEDEMHCLITGLNFLVQEIPYEVFTYDERRAEPMVFDNSVQTELFPYLVPELTFLIH
jgi:pantothenate kinase